MEWFEAVEIITPHVVRITTRKDLGLALLSLDLL